MSSPRQLVLMEIEFMRNQCAWLAAFSHGIRDTHPHAADELYHHAQIWVDEAEAIERALGKET
jgi:hypothetical protein